MILAILASACAPQAAPPTSPDLILRGGWVLDGTGNPWYQADVAVKGDRILAVGRLNGIEATTEVDVQGLFLTPGFIDVHSHAAQGLSTQGLSPAPSLLAQGITTVVLNPDDGGDAWDLQVQREALLEHGLGLNVAQYIGHGAVRSAVLGMSDRAPNQDELQEMRLLTRAAMELGAVGLSSGLFSAPGAFADTDELVALARVVAEYDGIYASHIRDEADYTVGLLVAVEEVITVASEAGIPGIVTHVKALGPRVWGLSDTIVARVEEARARGVELWADQYPYAASATSLVAALIPQWALEGGRDALLERLGSTDGRARIVGEMEENLERRGGAARIQFRRFEVDPSIEGRTLAEVAEQQGITDLEAALYLVERGNPQIVSFNMSETDLRTFMRQPWVMTSSDGDLVPFGEGVPHPRTYGAFPRKLQSYVLEERVVTLENAIRSMTSLPAMVMRLPDRGVIRAGAFADLAVLDLDRIRDAARYEDPHQLAEGVVHLYVNGLPAIQDGVPTEGLHGRVLDRAGPEGGR